MVPIRVAKLGGSLFSLPDLGPRFLRELASWPASRWVIVPGGGAVADQVREWDKQFSLGEVQAHDLAIRSMSLTARLLELIIPRACKVDSFREMESVWSADGLVIANIGPLLKNGSDRPQPPTSWDVSSDSLAAWLAHELRAEELIVFKSIPCPGAGIPEWSAQGAVDPHFPVVAAGLNVRWVNLRDGC